QDFTPGYETMDIQHRMMVIHGSRIIGAGSAVDGVAHSGLSDKIDTIKERLDLVVAYGGDSFERASSNFMISGYRDASMGMWDLGALSQYAESMIQLDDMLENGKLHGLLDESMRDSGVAEENLNAIEDEIVSYHIQEVDLDVYAVTELDLGAELADRPVSLSATYLEAVNEAREVHDTLSFVSGLGVERPPVEHAMVDLTNDTVTPDF
ncbi:hypothetical protein, partial [Roseibium sp.]